MPWVYYLENTKKKRRELRLTLRTFKVTGRFYQKCRYFRQLKGAGRTKASPRGGADERRATHPGGRNFSASVRCRRRLVSLYSRICSSATNRSQLEFQPCRPEHESRQDRSRQVSPRTRVTSGQVRAGHAPEHESRQDRSRQVTLQRRVPTAVLSEQIPAFVGF